MKTKHLLFWLGICLSYTGFAQQLIIFNATGKIIEQYDDLTGAAKYGVANNNGITLVVTGVDVADKDSYYLVYNFCQKHFASKGIAVSDSVSKLEYKDGISHLSVPNPNDKDMKVFSYRLIKTNKKGEDQVLFKKIIQSPDIAKAYVKEIGFEKIKSDYPSYLAEKISNKGDSLMAYSTWLKKLEVVKSRLNDFDYTISQKSNIKLRAKNILVIESLTTRIDKLTNDGPETTKEIVAASDKILALKAENVELDEKIGQERKQDLENKIFYEKRVNELRSFLSLEKIRDEYLTTNAIKDPFVNILHDGLLIMTDDVTNELVYEYQSKLIKPTSDFSFITMSLLSEKVPQLTTRDYLFARIINIDEETYRKADFKIALKINNDVKATDAELKSEIDVIGLQDFSIPTFASVTDFKLPAIKSKGFENNFFGSDTLPNGNKVKGEIEKLYNELVNSEIFKMNEFLIAYEKLEKYFSYDSTELNAQQLLLRRKLLINVNPFAIVFNAIIDAEAKKIEIITTGGKAYHDYLLPYTGEFSAFSKPKVELISTQNVPDAIKYKVSEKEGTQLEDFYITQNGNASIVTTDLPYVHKEYRFSFTAGLLMSKLKNYEYELYQIGGTNASYLKEIEKNEWKLLPSVFFSMYIFKNDIHEKLTCVNWYKKIELGLGVDYRDKKLLDNIYCGIGYEPIRMLHLVCGIRIGEITRLNFENIDVKNITDEIKAKNIYTVWRPAFYFGVNFGLSVVPSLVTKLISQ